MISARELAISWGVDTPWYWEWISHPDSRFVKKLYYYYFLHTTYEKNYTSLPFNEFLHMLLFESLVRNSNFDTIGKKEFFKSGHPKDIYR